jgi:hypothetical protein
MDGVPNLASIFTAADVDDRGVPDLASILRAATVDHPSPKPPPSRDPTDPWKPDGGAPPPPKPK